MQQFGSGSEEYYIQLKLWREFGVDTSFITRRNLARRFILPSLLANYAGTGSPHWVSRLYCREIHIWTLPAHHHCLAVLENLTACMYFLPDERSCSGAPEKALVPPTLHREPYPILDERGWVLFPWKVKCLCIIKTQVFIVIKTIEHHSGLSVV